MSSNPSAQNLSSPSTSLSSNVYSQQTPSASEPTTSSRFSFSLPSYRNPQHQHPQQQHPQPHTSADLTQSGAAPSSSSFPQSSYASQVTANHSSRHPSISSSTSNYHPLQQQQQQQPLASQLLQPTSTTPSSSSFAGPAVKPAGGGGGSSAGSSVHSLAVGQIHLLLATINERNYETKRREIQRIMDSDTEVHARSLRKLIIDNYAFIHSHNPTNRSNEYRILVDLIKSIANSPQTAKEKFADPISQGGAIAAEAGVFREFDLAAFLGHLGLDAFSRSVLAIGFASGPRDDLRSKCHEILLNELPHMLDILANPSKHSDMPPESIASFVGQLSSVLPERQQLLNLSQATRARYKHTTLPPEILRVTEPIEQLRQEESLLQILQQYGPDSVAVPENCREILKRRSSSQVTEEEIADVLVLMATSPNPLEWKARNLVQALPNAGASLNWLEVISRLDREDFAFEDPSGIRVLLDAIQQATIQIPEFPIGAVWGGRWKHPRSQWSVLRAYIKSDDVDITSFAGLRRVFSAEDFDSASSTLKAIVASFESHKLISLDAIDALLYLSLDESIPPEIRSAAQQELDKAAKYAPELVLCGAVQLSPPRSTSLENAILSLLAIFFEGHTSYQLVFWRLWQINKKFVLNHFEIFHRENPLNITRILDISQDLRCLSDLLEVPNAGFVLDVAALAARREYLNLDKWLQEMLKKYGVEFMVECYRFLRMKADAETAHTREGKKQTMVSLRVGPVYTFLTVLDTFHYPQSPEMLEQVTDTQRMCIQAYPRLINLGAGFDNIILTNNAEGNSFAAHIDKDMQQHYKSLYSQEYEVRDLIEFLKKIKISQNPREQDLFACMIHGLFDEYDCFRDYPIQALATTSVLFGSIVRYKIIDGIPLRVAMAMVYQAVRDHMQDTMMYKFGLQALIQFKERLHEWKSYCGLLLQVPGLQGTEIFHVVEGVINGTLDRPIGASSNGTLDADDTSLGLPNGASTSPTTASRTPFRSLHSDPPLRDLASYEDPSEDIQDKVLFIVNNVTHSNLESKLNELREWLEETHHQWFADYLVVKRAKLEPNYHTLYLDLLDNFGHRGLVAEVLRETYINVIKLLNAESTLSNQQERTHLKNLGVWLGGLTIARDKPIKFKNISFKDLLIEGWESERLTVVLPFTCKVLEQATKSTVFKPPNPWIMAILRLLKELYDNAGLKLNLKFEIEVLCGKLELNIKELEPATEIRAIKEQQAVNEREEEEDAVLALDNLSLQHPQEYSPAARDGVSSFVDHIVVGPMIRDQGIKRVMVSAVERTVTEILGPVVERSVTIATIATSQLILKDFATEPDESKLRNAAIGMAQRLAGNLALVTCKDPLRMSMVNNIRTLLVQAGYAEGSISDQTIAMVVNENLEIACRTVEKAAQEQAIPQIDDTLQSAYQLRKRHRIAGNNQAFISPDTSRIALQLPEVFRLRPGGLSQQQLGVYEEFARPNIVSGVDNIRSIQDALPAEYLAGSLHGTPGLVEASHVDQRVLDASTNIAPIDPNLAKERIHGYLESMRRFAKDSEESQHSLQEMRADSPIFQFIDTILAGLAMIGQPKAKENVCTHIASTICGCLFIDAQTQLEIDALVFVLQKVCDMSPSTAKEVLTWLSKEKDPERMLNVPVTIALLRSQLLSLTNLDETLSKWIHARKPTAVEFLILLLQETRQGDPPLAYRTDFAASFDAVGSWIKEEPTNKIAMALWKDLQGPELDSEDRDKRDQVEYIFTEWVQLCQHAATTEKAYSAFIIQLYQGRLISDLSSSAEFFRICIDYCVAEYETSSRAGQSLTAGCYIPMDALAKMIILLVKCQVDDGYGNEQMDKADYLNSLLALVVFVFNHHYETRKDAFSSKAFFRLFSTLLYEYHVIEAHLEDYHERILETFAECFMILQPTFFPQFTFHWVTLFSHRYFMPKMLNTEKGRPAFSNLLQTLFIYINEQMRDSIPGVVKILYKGSLRLLLVIHHDFPEFLAEYYLKFCEAIPTNCIQQRNLILSALPSSLNDMPDPFTSGFQTKSLGQDFRDLPKIHGNLADVLIESGLKPLVDSCLKSAEGPSPHQSNALLERLEAFFPNDGPMESSTMQISTNFINSLALYVGTEAIIEANAQGGPLFQEDSAHTVLLTKLAMALSVPARYYFLSGIVDHLRYPNGHTFYFGKFLLHLFDYSKNEAIQEVRQQIVRVLLERMFVHRPHPWGLIVTILELFQSPEHDFWNVPFIQSAPEIPRLFGSIINHIENSSPPRQ